jgi:hypothetical protein
MCGYFSTGKAYVLNLHFAVAQPFKLLADWVCWTMNKTFK